MEVETLFQNQPIAAVREVEARTRREIEEKKQQLRQVVGDSYRDLISSADTIVDISRSCHRLVDLAGELQSGLGALAGGAAGVGADQPAAASSLDRLYDLGSRIKFLLDTPETLYGCLDGGDFLAAARRYVRAAEVHRGLTAGQARQVAQRFPLLQHQWPLVRKFRGQVGAAAAGWLASHGELGAGQAAAALAAEALLKPMDGAELLKAFLTARQTYALQCLSAATGAGADTDLDSLACILADVATMVCATLAQCGELFLPLPGVSATPLLARALAERDGAADLLFESGREAAAWQAHVDAAGARLAELSGAGLALECAGWLDGLSAALRGLGGRLLGPCASGQGLLQVEAAVRAALDGWRYQLQPDSAGAGAGDVPEEPPAALAWGDVCQWVLGRPSPLWPLLFEQPLLQRAQQLAAADLSAVVDGVAEQMGAALQEAAALPPSAPGAYQASSWSEAVELQPATPEPAAGTAGKRRRLGSHGRRGAAAGGGAQGRQLASWVGQAEDIVRRFDQQMGAALAAALAACGGAPPPGGAAAADARRSAGAAEAAASRALVLEPFVQDRCAEAAEGIAAALDAALLALPQADASAAGDAAYAPVATRALLLGRLALGLAGRSDALPLALGPPDRWRAAAAAGGGAPALGARPAAGGAPPPPPSARYDRLRARLRSVGLAAYGRWADWAAAGLSGSLLAALAADHTLAADAPLRGWEETVLGGGGEPGLDGGEGGGEMRFQLPAAPSPAAAQLALAAGQEADRAGGHLLEEEALQLFEWRLAGALLSALRAALEGGGAGGAAAAGALAGGLSEKGVLQLLFDVRFLMGLLAGGRPVGASASDATGGAAAAAARRREAAALEAQLSGRLDPIDWATYEPCLAANRARAAARRQVLFGLLLRSAPRPGGGGAEAGGGASADSNTLRMAAVGPRFSYLPVTTPAALLRQASGAQQARGGGQASLGVLAAAAPPGGPAPGSAESAAAYGFAALLAGRPRAGGEGEEAGGGAPAAAAMGAGVSAAANKLVGLLGEGTGLLSSFTRGFNN